MLEIIKSKEEFWILLLENYLKKAYINVEYERFDESIPNYSCAHVLYDNFFFYDKDSPYNNKGYATTALIEITKKILSEGNVPRIVLNIVPSNVKSKRVSEKAGFSYIVNDEYSVFHPDALIMYQEGLQPLKKEDEELYEMQMEKYEKYIAKAQESMNNKSNAIKFINWNKIDFSYMYDKIKYRIVVGKK